MRLVSASVLVLALSAPGVLSAQAVKFEGGSFERYLGQAGHEVALTYRRTDVAWQGLGPDVAVGLFPAALAGRIVRLQVDAGPAVTRMLGPAALILKAGVGGRIDLAVTPDIRPGLQAGIAAVVPLQRDCGLRLDLTRRIIFREGERDLQWSLAVGLAVMPKRQRDTR